MISEPINPLNRHCQTPEDYLLMPASFLAEYQRTQTIRNVCTHQWEMFPSAAELIFNKFMQLVWIGNAQNLDPQDNKKFESHVADQMKHYSAAFLSMW